ncbi:MAG: hypothetical protein LBF60_04875 [Treponema sp.]|nr:hypothetical protein [Treponema sp.]
MEFITGESRDQIILLPDSREDYVEDNNSARVIEALFLRLRRSPVDGLHAGQVDVPFGGCLCRWAGTDKQAVI